MFWGKLGSDANIDIDQLTANFGGDEELAAHTVEALVKAAVLAIPAVRASRDAFTVEVFGHGCRRGLERESVTSHDATTFVSHLSDRGSG